MDHLTGLSPRARSFAIHALHFIGQHGMDYSPSSNNALFFAAIAYALDELLEELDAKP